MTVLQLCERIARHSRTGLFTGLSLTEQADVLQAANAALNKSYDVLPAWLKEQTQGFTLPAPVTINNLSVTPGSKVVSSGAFSAQQIGCSIQIGDDPQFNQIVGFQNLLNPYAGVLTSAPVSTVYGDAWYSTSYPFDRVIGNPTFADQPFASLQPMQNTRSEGGFSWLFQGNIGRPMIWWPWYLGNSQGALPSMVIKFAPYPDQAYSMKVRMSFWPQRWTLNDITAATTVNIPDQLLEAGLLPVAIREFMASPIWKSNSPAADQLIDSRGVEGLTFLKNQVADPAAPNNAVYTPLGY